MGVSFERAGQRQFLAEVTIHHNQKRMRVHVNNIPALTDLALEPKEISGDLLHSQRYPS